MRSRMVSKSSCSVRPSQISHMPAVDMTRETSFWVALAAAGETPAAGARPLPPVRSAHGRVLRLTRYHPGVVTSEALAIDGGTPVRAEPLDFSKGAALIGAEEADAL